MNDTDQDYFEKKLEEQKKVEAIKDEEKAAKLALENKKEPHFCNLNTDPQISQTIYYGLKELPLLVGRKSDDPTPKIIFGASSVKA